MHPSSLLLTESGNSLKALDAAIRARQWNKAVQIVDVVDNSDLAKEYYGKIAEHYASVREFDVSMLIFCAGKDFYFLAC
jgi:intraflagellar transport protein 172